MKINYLFLFICLNIFSYAQANNIPTQANFQVVPVSPNAASLGKFGDIPVGHYTGTASISVPIYEISLDGKSFPISLSYHSSGIKVAQEAGCVGLGWALQGYGCIVKDVKGWDDFDRNGPTGYYFDTSFPVSNDNNDNNLDKNTIYDYLKYQDNIKDGEPDLFHFNCGVHSGTMFFDKINTGSNTSGVAKPIIRKAQDNLIVEYNIPGSWKIIDGDGYCYYFNTCETTEFFQRATGTNTHPAQVSRNDALFEPRFPEPTTVTAWYLDSIVSPKKNKIIFEYKKDYIYTLIQMQETVYHLISAEPSKYMSFLTCDLGNYVHSYSKIDQVVLSKIKTNHQTIEFITDDRMDIEPVNVNQRPQKIVNIKATDITGNVIKNVNLKYEYKGQPADYKNCRLFLKRMSESAGSETLDYNFNYVQTPQLPDKHSNQVDAWGYYNGKAATGKTWDKSSGTQNPNGITYIPELKIYDYTFLGRSEVVSNTYFKAGMLTSITYPSGLVTNFVYEPHDISNGSPATIEKELVRIGTVKTKNYIDEDDEEAETDYVEIITHPFTLSETKDVIIDSYLGIYQNGYPSGSDNSTYHGCIALKKENGDVVTSISIERKDCDKTLNHPAIRLLAGRYVLEIRKVNIKTQHLYFLWAHISYERIVNSDVYNSSKGGGARIKRIYSDYNDETVANTTYRYKINNLSSGLLMSKPQFSYLFSSDYFDIIGQQPAVSIMGVRAVYACGMSTSYTPFSSSAMGSMIGYSRVYEMTDADDATDRGIEYIFHNKVDDPLYETELLIPGFPARVDLRNGLLISKTIYNEAEKKVNETIYEYTCNQTKSIKGVKVYKPIVLLNWTVLDMSNLLIKFYDLKSERWVLDYESTTNYSQNGETITTYKQYSYSSMNHLPSRIDTENSDGKDFSTLYKYPTDYQDVLSLKMKNRNMVNNVVEMLQIRNGKVIDGQKTQYVDTLGMILPKTFYKLNLKTPVTLSGYSSYYKPEYTIDQYNNHGNILQTTGQSGLSTAYIWGYNNAYPIAEVVNSTYSTVNSILNDVSAFENSYTPNMLLIDNLRSRLPAAMVTTYTYKLLRGMQTQTSPLGVKISYEYDAFGRLQSISNNNEMIQSFKYNYKK